MTLFLQAVLSGILVGGVYALVGIGLTLVFGVMRVINFAHGELVMLGMYATWILFVKLGWDPYLSILAVAPLLFLWGALLQLTVIERALHALPQNQILLTIGLGLVMSNAAAAQWPGFGRRIHNPSRKVTIAAGLPATLPSTPPCLFFTGCGQLILRAARCSIRPRKNGRSPSATRFSYSVRMKLPALVWTKKLEFSTPSAMPL